MDGARNLKLHRRGLFGAAAAMIAAARFDMIGRARAQASAAKQPDAPDPNASFGALKQIEAGTLNVGYGESGPASGPPVLLLHGWPYDIHSFVEVAPILATAGFRVIVPYLRGYGTTRFLSGETPRNGQQAVVAVDAIALMDRLVFFACRRRAVASSGSILAGAGPCRRALKFDLSLFSPSQIQFSHPEERQVFRHHI